MASRVETQDLASLLILTFNYLIWKEESMKTVLILIALVLFAGHVFADTYVWEDDQGTVNYADDLGKVPKQYRKKAKIVGEEEPLPPETSEGQESSATRGESHKGAGDGAPAPDDQAGKERPAPRSQTGTGNM
jgi:Domain of unknown function (DUF4124)